MTYLFGDSSPSDLEIDYIEFLREALDFSAQVLAAHERMVEGAARAVAVRHQADAEVTRLEALGSTQARAIEAFDIGGGESPTAQCAQALLRGAAETVRASIERVRASSAADVGKIEDEARRDRERCVEALGLFLKRHDLPGMSSELRLQQESGSGYAARLYGSALDDVKVVLDLEIAPSHPFAAVVRVDKLVERLEVHAPETGGWLRKEVKLRAQRLDKEFITALVASATETQIQLRTAADGTGVGFDLVIPASGVRVSLRRVGEGSELPPFDLDETDSSKLRELKDRLVATTAELRRSRKALVEAAIGDGALAEARDPQIIVERLVAAMAPVVREIAKRSLGATELVLKRQTGDGRREEIFVSRRDLQVKLRGLGAKARALFAPLELGELPPEDAPKPAAEAPVAAIVPAATTATTTAATAATNAASAAPNAASGAAPAAAAPSEPKRPVGGLGRSSLFADALAVDKTPAPRARIATPPPGAVAATAATAAVVAEESVRIEESLDRLAVSDTAVRKPQ
jgi:hypothetical protein